MASTDTRSGFRLPWSSDRSQEPSPEAAAEGAAEPREATADGAPGIEWPETGMDAALAHAGAEPRPADPVQDPHVPAPDAEEPESMVDTSTAVATAQPPASAPRRSTKLMADLSAAIRATAEHAREQTLAQVEADGQQVVEAIRGKATDGAAALKRQSEEDIASIREWSKAEIARIREETEGRITARKATLEEELTGHAAAVERRVDEVREQVRRFEAAMAAYLETLADEVDPSRLATMAEEMPEAPSFDAWTDLDTLDISLVTETPAGDVVEPVNAVLTAEAEPIAGQVDTATEAAAAEAAGWEATGWQAAQPVDDGGWGNDTNAGQAADLESVAVESLAVDADGGPRWAAGETPDGFPTSTGEDAGDPVDRGAIMAALEAAAEAVVAAEAAADSADQAEAAADVAETAAELLVGRTGTDDDLDPEAQAALSARVDAGGYDTESFADRLASLLPGHGEGAVGDEQRTTQVVVSGLVSVASIASFKRHLGRVAGVQNVAVASGPEGEFVFNLTHRADLSFREAIPTMPGFAARVTSTADGVVNVTARDPEAEG